MSATRRARRWRFLVVLGMVAGLLPFVGARPALAASTLEIDPGYDGYFLPGRGFPVRVAVQTDRLVRGQLEVNVTTDGVSDRVTVSLPVEVPGSGAKEFVVVVPPVSIFQGGTVSVDSRLVADGEQVVAEGPRVLRSADDRELVGLMPSIVARAGDVPDTVPLAIDGGVAALFPLDAAHLSQAPAAFDGLGTIVASLNDLPEAGESLRRGLLGWIDRGGTLLVSAPVGTSVAGIPDEWQPDATGVAIAGLGRVRVAPVADGSWDRAILPTSNIGIVDSRFGFGMPVSVGTALAQDAGLRVPRIGWLLLFLIGYTLLVGPVVGVVTNRIGRAELAWVLVPALAIVFSAMTWATAEGLRSSAGIGHAQILEMSPAGGQATTFVGIASRGRTDASVAIQGTTWSARQTPVDFGGGGTSHVAIGSNGPSAVLRLAAGQFGVATVAGPVTLDRSIAVTAESAANGAATGTVANTGTYALDEVAVFIGNSGTHVGSLAPGEERSWTIDSSGGGGRGFGDPFGIIDARLWDDASGMNGRISSDSVVNYAAWSSATPLAGMSRPSGIAVGVGWTRDAPSAVTIDGEHRETKGRTALVASTPVVARGMVSDMTTRGMPLRSFAGSMVGGGGGIGGLTDVVRFSLPSGAAITRPLVARLPLAGRVEVWDGRRWRETSGESRAVPFGPDPLATIEVDVPAEAVVAGDVFLRVTNAGGPMLVGMFTLSERS